MSTDPQPENPGRREPATSNARIVEDADGNEVDIEHWDPMPEELRRADDIDPTEHQDSMDGPAPTG